MKTILFLLTLCLTFCGCEDSSEPSAEERFSCKVDGNLWIAGPDDNTVLGNRRLTINYFNTGTQPSFFLSIAASNTNTSGVVSIGMACDSVTKINVPHQIGTKGGLTFKGGGSFDATSGTLTLSQLGNGRIAGTFQFTAKERGGTRIITVTDGKFNAGYISREE